MCLPHVHTVTVPIRAWISRCLFACCPSNVPNMGMSVESAYQDVTKICANFGWCSTLMTFMMDENFSFLLLSLGSILLGSTMYMRFP